MFSEIEAVASVAAAIAGGTGRNGARLRAGRRLGSRLLEGVVMGSSCAISLMIRALSG